MLTVRTYSRSRPTTNEPSRLLRSSALCIHALSGKRAQGKIARTFAWGNSWTAWRCLENTHTTQTHTQHPDTAHWDTATQTQTSTPNTAPLAPGPRARTCTHTHKTADHAPGRCHGPSPPPILRAHATQHGTNPPTPCEFTVSTWTTRAHRLRARLFCRVPQRRACLSGRAEMRRRRLIATPVARVPRARGRPWRAPSTWRCG